MEYGKLPPQSLQLEEAVIGAILVENVYSKCSEILSFEDFYSPSHQLLFKAFTELFRQAKPIDILTVIEQLKKTSVKHQNSVLSGIGGRCVCVANIHKRMQGARAAAAGITGRYWTPEVHHAAFQLPPYIGMHLPK
jgi:replicative DNA helicase